MPEFDSQHSHKSFPLPPHVVCQIQPASYEMDTRHAFLRGNAEKKQAVGTFLQLFFVTATIVNRESNSVHLS
jgi:hypothetical protein